MMLLNTTCPEYINPETESGTEVAGAGGEGMGSYCLTGTEFLFGVMKRFWN